MKNKREIRALIADGKLDEAAQAALAYAEAAAEVDTLNGFIALQADLAQAKELWISGLASYEEQGRTQARITQGLLQRVNELPEDPTPQASQRRIREEDFKWLVFYGFLLAKLLVFAWAFFVWQVEGFLNAEAFSLFNALLPGTVINASIMFRSLFRSSMDAYIQRRFVQKRFRGLVIWVFLGYILVQYFLIFQKVKGNLSFELATLGFAAVETALGQFMSELLEGIFKREKE